MSATALTLAAFLGLAARCAPEVAPETLAAIARKESGFDPLAIGVNGPGGGAQHPTTIAEAIAKAEALIRAGRSIDLGIMQINSRNLGWLGLSVADAFDPCRSIGAGARVLVSFSGYNTGSRTRGFANGYVQGVVDAHAANDAAPALPAAPAPAASPPPPPPCAPAWDSWALARCQQRARRVRPATPESGEGAAPRPAPPAPEFP